jgi:YfiH family protein
VRVTAWAAHDWLRAGFSTRQGGLSTVYAEGAVTSSGRPVGEQNLGFTELDDPAAVAKNRLRLAAAVAGKCTPPTLVTVRQIHSSLIRVLDQANEETSLAAMLTSEGKAALQGDGLMTAEQGLLLGIMTADCVPILIADTKTRAVAAFHAGWRGTVARIVEHGVGAMRQRFGSKPEHLIAAIGPAIGACCYIVGAEVRSQFEGQFAYADQLFRISPGDKASPGEGAGVGLQLHLDLHEANRRQLLDAGLKPKAITVLGECTACTRLQNGRRKYFSYRAEAGVTGRMMAVIGTV